MLGRVVSQWRRRQSSVRTRLTRIVNRALEKVGVRSRQRPKGRPKGNKGRSPHPRREYGPCGLVCADPPIIQTGIAFEEYAGIAPAFGRMHGSLPAAFLIYPCWTLEDRRRSAAVIATARAHQEKYPAHELVFLCNSEAERRILSRAGLKAHFLNKNFTVSETIFRPLSEVEVAFDAIYNARIDPDKRHDLAQGIERVAYISYVDSTLSAGARQKQRETLAGMLARQPHHVLLNPIEDGLPVRLLPEAVNEALNRAAVGLCLSNVEGSNYASMEYMLAGLPVVSTPSVGGRDVYFDPEYCAICEPNSRAVRDAVAALKARNIPRDYIRARTLAKIEPARRRFQSLVDDLRQRLGGERRPDPGTWPYGADEFLIWNKFQRHLQDFATRRLLGAVSAQLDPDIENLVAGIDGIQMELPELRAVIAAIRSRPGRSLLVFGCGNDSVLWEKVNGEGETAFLEDDADWADRIRPKLARARIYPVAYGTTLSEWRSLLKSPGRLELALPDSVGARRWDVILVDGPAGYGDYEKYGARVSPGRMKSIYMASKLVAPGGIVFVHDCDRAVERSYAARYLGANRRIVSVRGRALLQGYAF